MKMVKSLILGSAAALVAVGGAQAADLPVKAKAVEYVKVCSLYGPGFYYIPGTDTCIKLGGYLRVDVLANTNSDNGGNNNLPGSANNRFTNGYTWRSREDLNIDTRTATEYGVVRTFFDGVFSYTTDNYTNNPNAAAPGSTIYSAIGGGTTVNPASAPGNASSGSGTAGQVGVYYAFIQFAGFTIGKAVSQFSAPWTNYPGNNYDGLVGGGGTVTGINQFSYTAEFGNGVSASVSAEDQTTYDQATLANLSAGLVTGTGFAGGSYGVNDRGGSRSPNFVGKVVVDQAWGLAQLSVAAQDNHAAYYGGPETTGHPGDKWGWAVQGALSIKNIPTGPGDTLNVQAVYTDGASRYNFQNLAPQSFAMFGGTGLPGAYQSVGLAAVADGVFATGTGISTVQTWGMRGAYTHNWSPYWNTAIYGAYAQLKYGNGGTALVCAALAGLGAATAGITTCNPDFNVGQIGLITRWTPVKNLTFSADVTYTNLDQKFAGTIAPTALAGIAKPAAVYELKDQNTVSLLLRAQRNW